MLSRVSATVGSRRSVAAAAGAGMPSIVSSVASVSAIKVRTSTKGAGLYLFFFFLAWLDDLVAGRDRRPKGLGGACLRSCTCCELNFGGVTWPGGCLAGAGVGRTRTVVRRPFREGGCGFAEVPPGVRAPGRCSDRRIILGPWHSELRCL